MDSEGGGQAVRFSKADTTPAKGLGNAISPALQRTLSRMLARGERGAKGGLVMLQGTPEAQLAQFQAATGRAPSAGMARSIRNGNVQGMFDPRSGLLFVGADLDAEVAVAVLLHEATHGQRRPALDAKAEALLAGEGNLPAETRAFLDRVKARMGRVGESGARGEALAYIVEAAALEGRKAGFSSVDGKFMDWVDRTLGQPVGDVIRRLVAQLRAWAANMGLPMNVAVDDLLALARGDLKRAARGDVVADVDGARVMRSPSAKQEVETASDAAYLAAVERGDMDAAQAMVDKAARAAGYTIKAYHGTDADTFTVFKTERSIKGGKTRDPNAFIGSHFAGDRQVAERFTDELFGAKGGRVVPVYLHIAAPLQIGSGKPSEQTLAVLAHAKRHRPAVLTKTSLMLGLGETDAEILQTLDDLRGIGVDLLTLGQYLRPTVNHLPVARFVAPEEFERYRTAALERGFVECVAGPLVRSSYRAEQALARNNAGLGAGGVAAR
jgi:hypothetical protein